MIQDGSTYIQHYFVAPHSITYFIKEPPDQLDNPLDHLKAQDIVRLIIDGKGKVPVIENIRISNTIVFPYTQSKVQAMFAAFRTNKSIEQLLAELQ